MASPPSTVVTMPSNKLCGGRNQTAAGNATAAEMEPTDTYRVTSNASRKTTAAISSCPRCERQINAGAGGDAFAALELEPAGVIVAEHGKYSCQNSCLL